MAIIQAMRNVLWLRVDAEQRIAEFHAEVDRLARERGLQDDPIARMALTEEVYEQRTVENCERLARRGKWGFWIVMAAIALWTAVVLVFG